MHRKVKFFVNPNISASSLIKTTSENFIFKIYGKHKFIIQGTLSELSIKGKDYEFKMTPTELNIIKKNNNRRDLLVLIHLLEFLDPKIQNLTIYTNNIYIQSVINDWIRIWKPNNFISNKNVPRPNHELLRIIAGFMDNIELNVKYIYDEEKFNSFSE